MKSSTASGKSYIDVTKRKLPTQAPDDYSSGAFCIKLSPQWFGVVIGLIDHLLLRGVWEDKTDEQWSQLRRWIELVPALIVDCNQEGQTPDEPVIKKIYSGDSGASETGVLGLTVSEMEDLIMGSFLRGQLAWINGKLHYAVGGCDDWCPVPVLEGTAPTVLTPEVIGALSQGELTYDQWEDAGSPNTVSQPQISTNPIYTTDESLACVKATALVETAYWMLDNVVDEWESAGTGTQILSIFVAGLVGVLSVPAAAVAAYIASIIFYTQEQQQTKIAAVRAVTGDAEMKAQIICELVPKMDAVVNLGGLKLNQITDKDTKNMIDTFLSVVNPTDSIFSTLLKQWPMQYWKNWTVPTLPNTECGCETFLPFGYIPPAQGGAINFIELANCGSPTSSNNWTYIEGLPDSGMQLSPDQGQVVSAGSWRTTYTGADTAGGEPNKYTKAALLLDMPDSTRIDQIKFDMVVNGVVQGLGDVNMTVHQVILNAGNVWQLNNPVTLGLETATDLIYDTADLTGSKMAILFQTRNENINLYAVISNLRFTGDHAGGGFLDVPLGQPLP